MKVLVSVRCVNNSRILIFGWTSGSDFLCLLLFYVDDSVAVWISEDAPDLFEWWHFDFMLWRSHWMALSLEVRDVNSRESVWAPLTSFITLWLTCEAEQWQRWLSGSGWWTEQNQITLLSLNSIHEWNDEWKTCVSLYKCFLLFFIKMRISDTSVGSSMVDEFSCQGQFWRILADHFGEFLHINSL